MLSLITYLQTIYDFFLIEPLSVLVGLLIGGVIGYKVKLPKSGMTLFWLFILLILSPKIGINTYLIKIYEMGILLNALLYSSTLTVLIILLYRFYIIDTKPYIKESK